MNGRSWWLVDADIVALDPGPILGAIVEPDRIAFDTKCGDEEYTVSLAPAPAGGAWWKGRWRCKQDGADGHLEARMYTAADGGTALIGTWRQVDADQPWVVELRPS